MNNNLKKALLLTSASLGLLSVSVATADVASAGNGYASGSVSVTNIDSSTYSAGAEMGGAGKSYNSVTVTPIYGTVNGTSSYQVNGLTVNSTPTIVAGGTMTISEQVVSVLNSLSSNGTNLSATNVSNYVGVIRAAGGANGLE